jgi:hypothetical protein
LLFCPPCPLLCVTPRSGEKFFKKIEQLGVE